MVSKSFLSLCGYVTCCLSEENLHLIPAVVDFEREGELKIWVGHEQYVGSL